MTGMKPDEDIRRPLQWSDQDISAGFSDGKPWRPPFEDYPGRNIENQTDDPDSLLSHYRQLIHLRSNHEALRIGDWTLVETRPGKLLAFLRQSDNESILVLINPNKQTVDDYALALAQSNLHQEVKADQRVKGFVFFLARPDVC